MTACERYDRGMVRPGNCSLQLFLRLVKREGK